MESIVFGPFTLFPIETGTFKLDGGAMFGVVPKTLWSKQIPADENNRIFMGMRCLLIKSSATGRTYLIDCGLGTKFDAKQSGHYEVDTSASSLESSLAKAGTSPVEITDLVLTHLHFDHVGGATKWENGKAIEVFKNARYHVMRHHWETATKPNKRERASFFPENLDPLIESGRLILHDDAPEYEPGFDALVMNGHTIAQQLPRLRYNGKTIVYAGDLIPTAAHVPLPWIMGYDMQPLLTLEEKEQFLQQNANANTVVFLEHDAFTEAIIIENNAGKFQAAKKATLAGLIRELPHD
jgi:glyoxylase-like metal-dependent hydrolase (beta-lactamase superfamily II)